MVYQDFNKVAILPKRELTLDLTGKASFFFFNFFYIGNHTNIFYKIFTLQQQYEINNMLIKANGPKLNFKQTP